MSSTALTQSNSQQSLTRTTSSTDSLPILNLTPRRQTATAASPAHTPSSPRTPNANGAHSTPNTTPGWLHPRMDEVIRRRNASNFDTRNMRAVLLSAAVIAFSFFMPNLLGSAYVQPTTSLHGNMLILLTSVPLPWQQILAPYPNYILWAARLIVLSNALFACKPLLLTPDACEDVPLTPQQRKLLGLPPMTRPATPQEREQYVTPPRFSRSATPRSSSGSVRIESGDSPLSGRATPVDANGSFRMSGGGSPFASPTVRGSGSPYSVQDGGERRRLSYNNPRSSPLTVSEFEAMSNPSPSGGRKDRASVGLNNKWLYEKGRRGSGGAGRMPQTPGGGRMPGMAGLY